MTDQILQLLATQAWQIAALAIVVAVVNRTVAKNRPHLAHALWMLVLIKCVIPPIWGHSLGLFSQLQAMWKADPVVQQDVFSDEPLLMPPFDTDDEIALAPPANVSPLPGLIAMKDSEAASTPIVPVTLPTKTANSSFVPEAKPWKPSWPTILLSLVASGALLTISIMVARCVLCLRHIQRHRTTEFDESLNEQLQRLSRKLRLRRVPRIIVSDVLFGPAVIGLWRHVIVLPRCLINSSRSCLPGRTFAARRTVVPPQTEQRQGEESSANAAADPTIRSCTQVAASREVLPGRQDLQKLLPGREDLQFLDPILAHELLHIRRGDLRTGTLQAIVQSLWWFHPAVWLCNRWLSREAERCCDEQVIAELGCSPAQYARSLLSVIESKHALQPIPVFPGMKPVEITSQRMERIMSLKSNLKKQTPLWCWLAIAVLAVVVLPGAMAKPATDEETVVTQPEEMSEPHPSRQMDTAPVQLSTKEYIVGDLTERLAKEQNLSLEQAKQSLVEMFEGSVSPVHRVAPRVVAAPAIVQQPALPRAVTEKELLLEKSGRIEQLSSYVFKDDHLVVTQSDAGHAELQMHIERVRRLGFLQFQLTARYVVGPAEDINVLMASQKLEKPFIAKAGRKSDSTSQKSTDKAGKELVTFQTSHSGIISIEQARSIEELARAKADRFSLQRPKVIAFNGQIATIRFGETKPFIVGFKEDGEPTIRTMDEGLTLRVTPTVVDTGLFRLKSVASVESASVLRQINAPGKVTETPRSFHVPGITTQQIQTTVELRDDQALYLTGLTTAKDGKEQAVLVILEATLAGNRTLLNANPEVNSIDSRLTFEGNTFWSDVDLAKQLSQNRLASITRSELASELELIKQLYHSVGFFDVEVSEVTSPSEEGIEKNHHFRIKEGPRFVVKEARYEGNTSIATNELLTGSEVQAGDHFNSHSVSKDVKRIRGLYQQLKLESVRVDPVPRFSETSGEVVVVFEIDETNFVAMPGPVSEPLVKLVNGRSGDLVSPIRPVPATIGEASAPQLKLVWETREQVSRRLLSTDQHTPWQIMSGIEGLRRDMVLKNGDTTVNALEWIQAGPMYQGEPWFEKTEYGGRAHPYSTPYWFEGHVNQFLSKFAACQLPLHATFGTPDGPITIQDMINHAKMVVNDKEAVSWTLLALSRYLPPDAKWTNAKGEEWSIERLVDIEVGKTVGGPTSPNGGTDGLYALSVARDEYLKTGKPLEGVWLKADEKIKKYIDLAKSQQNPDGTLSSDFFRSGQRKETFDKRLSSTSHLLQFLMHAVSDEQLKEDWIRQAVETTAYDIQVHRKEFVACDPLFTATEALTTYLERTQGISLGLVASPLPPNVASRQTLPMPLNLVSYAVAAQVVPVWTGATKADFAPIVELIKTTVEPESWREGQAEIVPYEESLSLVIRQTPQAHEQIAKLLSQLNDDLDQIVIRCRLMKLTSEQQLKGVEDRCSLNAMNEHKRWALLTKERSEGLAKFLTDENCQVLLCPNITMFSGTSGTIQIGVPHDGSFQGYSLFVEPRIVVDSPIIRLKHAADFAKRDGSNLSLEAEAMNSIAKDESLIGSGQTLLLLLDSDGSQRTANGGEKSPETALESGEQFVLMLTVERLEEKPVKQ